MPQLGLLKGNFRVNVVNLSFDLRMVYTKCGMDVRNLRSVRHFATSNGINFTFGNAIKIFFYVFRVRRVGKKKGL